MMYEYEYDDSRDGLNQPGVSLPRVCHLAKRHGMQRISPTVHDIRSCVSRFHWKHFGLLQGRAVSFHAEYGMTATPIRP